ncbi:DUF6542 domain-containing protein [Nocardiopsis kunsanensis]|uniref:DUF6542 domain-containing protein n=1 Tax=Nocardiopsis kunsanensis TaxID=141693 RepID=A0A918XG87_9ACTN|nr:DUF6542 domain-containing protein [Nocardiopsis kunsanensis]GHD30487.1 hypothetical protein GCM10007147_32330 [Nocardiopsis kunsanensis]
MPPRRHEDPEPGHAPYFVRSEDRGTHTAVAQKAQQRSGRAAPRPARPSSAPAGPLRLTGRGGVLLIVLFSVAGTMIAHAASWPAAPGIAFTAACLLTAATVRPPDLLSLSVSPPIAFFVSVVSAESVLALGNDGFTRVLMLGLASRLAEVAPWLFLGTALVLVIAVFRGLPGNLRELGDELNGRR